MAKQQHIEDTHKGEPIKILLEAKGDNGSIISSPNDQTITMTISKNEGGPKLLAFDSFPQIILTSVDNGEWLITLEENDIAGLQENQRYFYNIWSQRSGEEPRLQAYGRLMRLRSIRYD